MIMIIKLKMKCLLIVDFMLMKKKNWIINKEFNDLSLFSVRGVMNETDEINQNVINVGEAYELFNWYYIFIINMHYNALFSFTLEALFDSITWCNRLWVRAESYIEIIEAWWLWYKGNVINNVWEMLTLSSGG